MMDEIMRSRRSIRRFRPEAPSREDILAVLDAATLAPSASNRQPWRFVVVTDRDVIERMGEAVREAAMRIARGLDDRVVRAFSDYAENFSTFTAAPVLVVVGWRTNRLFAGMLSDAAADEDRRRIEDLEDRDGVVGASMAAQNLLLAAHERGLGAAFMTGPLLAEPDLRKILDVSGTARILGLVPIGYPAETPDAPPRKSVARVARWIEKESVDE